MKDISLILIGKMIIIISKLFNIGSGSTWPGQIALNISSNFIKDVISKNEKLKIILIAGTNGKTTTGKIIQAILKEDGRKVFLNKSGANLLNGIASSLAQYSNLVGGLNYDNAIFEVDENTLPLILKEIKPDYIILLNLFRDQLDRYGEVNIITSKWNQSLKKLSSKTTLILNSDDPQIAYLGLNSRAKNLYYGVSGESDNTIPEHASDSTYCPKCGYKLAYNNVTFSHLGDWKCNKCGLKKPKSHIDSFDTYPLPGLYNKYNTHAAVLAAKTLGVADIKIKNAIRDFEPAFGRQEIIKFNNKNIQILLSKNPASFNQSLDAINKMKAENLLIVLNDRIPDGQDISWIWDVDFEHKLDKFKRISVSGDRPYDMSLRLLYSIQNFSSKVKIYDDLKEAIKSEVKIVNKNEILYVLPTYSAMLELRKIITGKKIL